MFLSGDKLLPHGLGPFSPVPEDMTYSESIYSTLSLQDGCPLARQNEEQLGKHIST